MKNETFGVEPVKQALSELGVMGMTVSEVKGFGRQKSHEEVYRGAEYNIDFTPKLAIDVVVTDQMATQTVDTVPDAAKSGQIGDGKIVVLAVEDVVRIRIGESGGSAL
tara:strand:- start:20 stop:343 length:324 start_codon:yes stop_codon:yes gene_type:complete